MCNRSFGAPARYACRLAACSWPKTLAAALLSLVFCVNGTLLAAEVEPQGVDDWGAFVPGVALLGAASMYNPYASGVVEDDGQTASGETYDPEAWTAAIQVDLRDRFGGVRFGTNYSPSYAMVECFGRRTIVKINDVGPLRPGRIIDLNLRAMRYCDPSLDLGVLSDVSVTPLQGAEWTPGPVFETPRVLTAAEETVERLQ